MIPDYQTLMLPLLKFINDEQIHSTQDAVSHLARKFNLGEEELNEWLPSKKQKTFHNRVHWAKAHLKMAGAVENKVRGQFQITNRGIEILNENPSHLNIKYLTNKYEDYKSLLNRKGDNKVRTSSNEEIEINDVNSSQTPSEQLEKGYEKIKISLLSDIISNLKKVTPPYFEKIVVKLLVKMGYGGSFEEAGKATKYTNDEGIDGIINEDKLGLDVIYIQAKRWEGTVGRPEIQKFVGALAGQRAKKGVFITTSNFSKEAMLYAAQMDAKIILIDGEKLAQYMIDYNVGVSVKKTYEIKIIDSDFFEED
jgi:restriction system protein